MSDTVSSNNAAAADEALVTAEAAPATQPELPEATQPALPEVVASRARISSTISLNKFDSRCRGWAIIVRADDALPLPGEIHGANDIGLRYARQPGETELFPGDYLLQGEANHHRRNDGWRYWLFSYTADPAYNFREVAYGSAVKAKIKEAISAGSLDLSPEYLRGEGAIAGMVRVIHAERAGFVAPSID